MRTASLTRWLIVATLAAAQLCPSSAIADDPISMWNGLSPTQQAEVSKTLTKRLPAALSGDAKKYAKTLATEIPRWVGVAQDFESGDYASMFVGRFENELTEFVQKYIDERLPQQGFARWLFDRAKKDSDSLKKVAIAIADPNKSWDDVRNLLWSEVYDKVQAESQKILKNFVRDTINDALGTSGKSIASYTPGDLYILAVVEWADFVARWPKIVEQEAANELYAVYRKERAEADGNRFAAEATVRALWAADRVPGKDGRRQFRSWTARLTHLNDDLKVQPDELLDKLLVLFDRYYNTANGQDDFGFYGWLSRELREEIRATRRKLKREADEELRRVQAGVQRRLQQIHKEAAIQLRAAIEAQLTDEQRDARDAAILQAERLVDLMWRRNVLIARKECAEFSSVAGALTPLRERLTSAGSFFAIGMSDFLAAIKQKTSRPGGLVNGFEQELGNINARIGQLEAKVAVIEQEAGQTCKAASQINDAPSKEAAREKLDQALRHNRTAKLEVAAAQLLSIDVENMQQRFLKALGKVESSQRREIDDVKRELERIDAELATLREIQQLETTWNGLYQRLATSARRQHTVQEAFKVKAQRIQTLLAPHNPNERIMQIHRTVKRYDAELACVRANWQSWESYWAGYTFPTIEKPDPQELQEARNLLAAYSNLIGLKIQEDWETVVAGVARVRARIHELLLRAGEAESRADLCAAKAIVDYDNVWIQGNTPNGSGNVEPEEPEEPDAELPPGDDEIGLNEPDAELPPGDNEIGFNEPDAELPPGDDEIGLNDGPPEVRPDDPIIAQPDGPRPEADPDGADVDGAYTIFVSEAGGAALSDMFEAMVWKAQGENKATVTLTFSRIYVDQALAIAGVDRTVTVTATRRVDRRSGQAMFVADGPEMKQVFKKLGYVVGMAASAAGRAFAGGEDPDDPVNVTVNQARVTFVHKENGVRVLVTSDVTLQIGRVTKDYKKNRSNFARRRN